MIAGFHGTFEHLAFKIMTEGFRLYKDEIYHGRVSGSGIYFARELKTAAYYESGIIIKVKCAPGLKILWIDLEYDKKILSYLKKEFGRAIVKSGVDFYKSIPRNKQLKADELRVLVNYIFEKRARTKIDGKKSFSPFWGNLVRLSEHIRRHGYDGIGNRSNRYWDSDEILVFNPSNVKPLTAHRAKVIWTKDFEVDNVELSDPLDLDKLKEISAKAQKELDDWDADC